MHCEMDMYYGFLVRVQHRKIESDCAVAAHHPVVIQNKTPYQETPM